MGEKLVYLDENWLRNRSDPFWVSREGGTRSLNVREEEIPGVPPTLGDNIAKLRANESADCSQVDRWGCPKVTSYVERGSFNPAGSRVEIQKIVDGSLMVRC